MLPLLIKYKQRRHEAQAWISYTVFHSRQWPCVLLVAERQIKRPPTGSPSAHTGNHAISTFTPNATWPPCLLPWCEIESDNHSQRAQSACIWSWVLIVAVLLEITPMLTAITAVLIHSPWGELPLENIIRSNAKPFQWRHLKSHWL